MKANKKNGSKKTTKPVKKTNGKKAQRFTLFDFSATSIIRKLGKLGWKPGDAIKALQAKMPKLSANTIRVQLYAGRHGLRGEPAPLSKVQIAQLKKLAA